MGRQIEPFGRSVVVGPYRFGCIRRVDGRGRGGLDRLCFGQRYHQ